MIGAAACFWYFEAKTESKGQGKVGSGIKLLLRYHLGSIAFGSLTIAFFQAIRWVFEYYRRKTSMMNRETKGAKVLLATTAWLLWVLEHFVKYFSKNAYI